jgi:hypothetical protein
VTVVQVRGKAGEISCCRAEEDHMLQR